MAWVHKSAPQLAMLFGASACSLPRVLSGIGATHRISALEWARTLGFRRCPKLSLAELLDQCRPQTPDLVGLRTMVDFLLANRFPLLCGGGQITPPSSPMPTHPFSEGNTPNLSGPLPRTSAAAARQLTLPKRGGAGRLAAPRNSPGLASCSSAGSRSS